MVDTPPDHFQSIIDRNENNIPKEGSIVEALSRFDERYNKLLVLTTENELLDVPALDVNFHLYRVVIPRDHIDFGQIVENRHNEGDPERVAAVDFICSFLDDVLELKRDLAPKFERVYAQFAGEAMNSISLIDVVDAIKFRETSVIKFGSSFYDQCVLLFAIHWNLIDSPKWIVPNYVPNTKLSNVITGHSNTFHSMSEYFVTPIPVWMATTKFVHQLESSRLAQDVEVLFRKLKETPKNELSSFMEVYEGRHLVYILDFLKFALVYPHESTIKTLERAGIFKDGVTARAIFDLLVELKIYDINEDVFLSLGLVGSSSLGED
ncbi:hypothetical protein Cantr_08936 [Candida viswanathii]|uniref:Uncharacterized protein n=1 Tax=Candida viswanathii TaxID=5486 RepID=A0A367YA58_9ASCO|nr:hypothetical protein Cantr_08936 [Candida viswanathii]